MRVRRNIWLGISLTLLAGVMRVHSGPTTNRVASVSASEISDLNEVGIASYYADKYHGKPTASGEVFDMHKLTAAHPTLPFGTRVKVTHTANKRSVIVRINDRGPFIAGRVIDVSLAAAEELQMVQAGLADVRLEVVK